MVEGSSSIEELRSKIGVEWEAGVYEIEKGMIRRFVQAIGDPNPLWQDEEYANQNRYGGVIAPPNFIHSVGFEQFVEQALPLISGERALSASSEIECYQPVRPGDTITATLQLSDVRERQGKMRFMPFDTTYKNQRQELVAKYRHTIVSY